MVAVADGEAALEDVAPVRARAVSAGKAAQHRREVMVFADRHEVDGVAVEIIVAVFGDAEVLDERGGLL